MKSVLVMVNGFIGDILFASSVANKLAELGATRIDYHIQLYQPYELLKRNPFIDNVYVNEKISYAYDAVFNIGAVDQNEQATLQFQRQCGIEQKDLRSEYYVYTNPHFDEVAKLMLANCKRPLVGWQSNWKERSFLFTEEQYNAGVDKSNNLGYGNARRDIQGIVLLLSEHYTMIELGFPDGVRQTETGLHTTALYSMTASLAKMCDWVVGAEGGITNLSAGVGTNTIITGDFIHQVYGPNGSVKQIAQPKMGPRWYFPNAIHHELNPFLTDEQVANKIIEIIGS